ncbi:hypothetical protein CYMTET_54494 [Cymbomonas tetramitiformis]|uniref:Uncharacterized protein n=1 Tax=Cymbomonas tetramitiformis TaxID=36881 RepID=A0AAE0BG62_9CHLO|nr:hypothetical protein CYMTET_54494 [Cymbomonas tetramitiformis]
MLGHQELTHFTLSEKNPTSKAKNKLSLSKRFASKGECATPRAETLRSNDPVRQLLSNLKPPNLKTPPSTALNYLDGTILGSPEHDAQAVSNKASGKKTPVRMTRASQKQLALEMTSPAPPVGEDGPPYGQCLDVEATPTSSLTPWQIPMMDMTSNGDLPLLRLQEEPGMLLVRLMPGTFAAQLKTFNGPHSNGWGNNFSHVIRLQNVLPQLEDYWETVQDKHRFLRKLGKDSTDPFQATNVLPQLEDYWETVQDKHRFLRKAEPSSKSSEPPDGEALHEVNAPAATNEPPPAPAVEAFSGHLLVEDHPTAKQLLKAILEMEDPKGGDGKMLLVQVEATRLLDPTVFRNVQRLFEENPVVHLLNGKEAGKSRSFAQWRTWVAKRQMENGQHTINFNKDDPAGHAIFMVGKGFTLSTMGCVDYDAGPATKVRVIIPNTFPILNTEKFRDFLAHQRKQSRYQSHYLPSTEELRSFDAHFVTQPPGAYFICLQALYHLEVATGVAVSEGVLQHIHASGAQMAAVSEVVPVSDTPMTEERPGQDSSADPNPSRKRVAPAETGESKGKKRKMGDDSSEVIATIKAQVLTIVNKPLLADTTHKDLKVTTIKQLLNWTQMMTPLIEEHGVGPLNRFKDSEAIKEEGADVHKKVRTLLGSISDRLRFTFRVMNLVETKADLNSRGHITKDSFLEETWSRQKDFVFGIDLSPAGKSEDACSNLVKTQNALKRLGTWADVGTALS